jgi:hypothetical protein
VRSKCMCVLLATKVKRPPEAQNCLHKDVCRSHSLLVSPLRSDSERYFAATTGSGQTSGTYVKHKKGARQGAVSAAPMKPPCITRVRTWENGTFLSFPYVCPEPVLVK